MTYIEYASFVFDSYLSHDANLDYLSILLFQSDNVISNHKVIANEHHLSLAFNSDLSPKRPHIRRAHYHQFWKGKRTDEKSRRKVTHFLPPEFVNM